MPNSVNSASKCIVYKSPLLLDIGMPSCTSHIPNPSPCFTDTFSFRHCQSGKITICLLDVVSYYLEFLKMVPQVIRLPGNQFDISFFKRTVSTFKRLHVFIAPVPSAESHSCVLGSNHKRQFPTSSDLNTLFALNCR